MEDFLECMIDLASTPLDSRLVQHLLSSPIGDGGQFDMVIVLSTVSPANIESRQEIWRCTTYSIP
jgi:hypothetical protein